MGQLGLLVSWKELTGTHPTRELLHQNLAPYNVLSVLRGLSSLSAQLITWQNRSDVNAELEAVRQTMPTYYHAIRRLTASHRDRVILTRANILYVAKQALLACEPSGRDPATAREIERVMVCCLMANDLLHGRTATPDDSVIQMATSLLPFASYIPHSDDLLAIARNLLLMSEIAPQLKSRSDYRDLNVEFESATTLTPQAFCELAFCAATKFLTNLAEQNNAGGLILTPTYFQHTSLPAPIVDSFLRQQTTTMEDLRSEARGSRSSDSDFLLFQDRPLIEFAPQHYICIDPGFLLEKAGRSFYWTLHSASDNNRRKHLLGYWGLIVEKYAQWLFAETYSGRGDVWYNPCFSDNSEGCDILIREGRALILVEIKASILTARAKYSFSPELLHEEVMKKAIRGGDEERKGLAQLHNAITRLLAGERIGDVDCSQVSIIYPVLVFLDRSFTAPYFTDVYAHHFDRTRFRKTPITTKPYALALTDLENMLPYSHQYGLSEIFDDYFRNNRLAHGRMAFASFSRADVPLLRQASRGSDPVRGRLFQFMDDLQHRLFPR